MFDLPEKITIWNKGKNSGYGENTWDGPYIVDARIAFRQEKFTDANGDTRMSKAVCYTESELLNTKSVVYLGASTEESPITEADDVRSMSSTPSGTGLRKAWF